MSHRSIRSRVAGLSLAAMLVAASPASAMPADPAGTEAKDPRQQDMHASTVQKQDDTQTSGIADARGEAAAGGGTAGASDGTVRESRLPGPPTWPMFPTPLPRPAPQPVVVVDGGDDIVLDLPVALLILTGTLALGGGMAVAALKVRGRVRTAH
jgi:hypothetical protein